MKGYKDTIYKTVNQHNQVLAAAADMKRMQEIARDCRTVKNYVYDRYSGIHSLPKLCPGYTIQNEMTKSGLRKVWGSHPCISIYLSLMLWEILRANGHVPKARLKKCPGTPESDIG
jgi:hypothetical protein